jgi:predicted  nucleic acid-binding Zn-ribbon protein
LLGIDLLDAKVAKERALGKDLTTAEELETYENEIKKLKIDPQKLRKQEEAGKYQNKLVRETELERYLNKGWEMVQTVNSRILVRKPILTSKRS